MELTVNGDPRSLPDGMTVAQLLEQLHVVPEGVVVEVNLDILKRHQYAATTLKPGDQIEIVQLVAGGAFRRSRRKADGSREVLLPGAWSLERGA